MDLRVFRYPMYTHAVLLFLIIIMAMFASEIILPIYMQGPLALTAATAGLVLLPGSILNGIMSPFMGHLFDKFGPRVLMIPATIVLSGTMFMMSRLTIDTPVWVVVLGYILIMLTVSAIMMPAETNGLNQLPKKFVSSRHRSHVNVAAGRRSDWRFHFHQHFECKAAEGFGRFR